MEQSLIKYANSNDKILNIIMPKKIYMKAFLKNFSEKYNCIEEYLKLIGVTDDIIKDIKIKFIE